MELLLQPDWRQLPGNHLLLKQISSWKTGTVLTALVERPLTPHSARVRIGGIQLNAQTALPLQPGAVLQLRVIATDPVPRLAVISQPPAEDSRPALALLLRSILPVAVQTKELAAGLRTLLPQLPDLPAALRPALTGIIAPQSTLLSSNSLRQLLHNSGHFYETRMAGVLRTAQTRPGTRAALAMDVKGNLLSAIETIAGRTTHRQPAGAADNRPVTVEKPAPVLPAEVTRTLPVRALLEGMVAKISLNQVQHLIADAQQQPLWLFDLPFQQHRQVQVLQLQLARDSGDGQHGDDGKWHLTLRLDLERLGGIRIDIRWQCTGIDITFYTRNRKSRDYLQEKTPLLQDRLQAKGKAVHTVRCLPGDGPEDEQTAGLLQSSLLGCRV